MPEQRESALLAAAEALLREGADFTSLRVEDVAQRAELHGSNFYFHFRDKRELLLRLADQATRSIYAQAELWWESGPDAPPRPEGEIAPIVSMFIEQGAVLSAVVEGAAIDAEVREHWRAIVQRFVEATARRIDYERERGRAVAGAPAAETAFALVWMIERACYQHVRGSDSDESALASALTTVWQLAIYGQPGTASASDPPNLT